jgi:hypothetical protein
LGLTATAGKLFSIFAMDEGGIIAVIRREAMV